MTAITINVSGPASVMEGDTATYTISLSPEGVLPPAGANFVVDYWTLAGTATQYNQKNQNVADYDWKSDAHTFNADNPGPFEVSVATFDDNRVEEDETFSFKIDEGWFVIGQNHNRLRPRIGTSTVTTTITSDDTTSSDIRLSISPSAMAEDDEAMSFVVTATLDGKTPAATDIPVAISLSGTATKDSDYTVKTALSSITIPAKSNSGSGSLALNPIDDTAVEPDEVITLSGSAAGFSVDPTNITIVAQRSERADLTISGPSEEVAEGSDAVFTATLSDLVSGEVTAEWRGQSVASGDNAEMSDYGNGHGKGGYPRGSFTIPANTLTHTFTVPVNDDDLAEPAEVFSIFVGEVSAAGFASDTISGNTRAFVTIAASDQIEEGKEDTPEPTPTATPTPEPTPTATPMPEPTTTATLTPEPTPTATPTPPAPTPTLTPPPSDDAGDMPGRPTNLAAAPPTGDLSGSASDSVSFTLTWNAPADGGAPSGYRILRRAPATESNLAILVEDTGSTGTTYTDNTASPNTKYIYRVKAVNAQGMGRMSRPAQICFSLGMPGRPSGLSARSDANGDVVLTWNAPAGGSAPSGYQILRRAPATESNLAILVEDTGSTNTTYTDSTAAPRTKYVYRVRALNAAGLGKYSLPTFVTPGN